MRVWDRHDQVNRSGPFLCQLLTFELGRSELRLEIDNGPLNLDVEHLLRACQHKVCCSEVARGHRDLESDLPARVSRARDGLRNPQLAGIAQANSGNRVEAPSQLVAAGCRQSASDAERHIQSTSLRLAGLGLADAGEACQLRLGQSGCDPGDAQLPPVPGCKL